MAACPFAGPTFAGPGVDESAEDGRARSGAGARCDQSTGRTRDARTERDPCANRGPDAEFRSDPGCDDSDIHANSVTDADSIDPHAFAHRRANDPVTNPDSRTHTHDATDRDSDSIAHDRHALAAASAHAHVAATSLATRTVYVYRTQTFFTCVYARRPSSPFSRPNPDCL